MRNLFVIFTFLFLSSTALLAQFTPTHHKCSLQPSTWENDSLDAFYGWDKHIPSETDKLLLEYNLDVLGDLLCVLRTNDKTRTHLSNLPGSLQENKFVQKFVLEDGTVPVFKLLQFTSYFKVNTPMEDLLQEKLPVPEFEPALEEEDFTQAVTANRKLAKSLIKNGVPLSSELPEEYHRYLYNGSKYINEPIKLSKYWEDPFVPVRTEYSLILSNFSVLLNQYSGVDNCYPEENKKEITNLLEEVITMYKKDNKENLEQLGLKILELETLLGMRKVKMQFFVHNSGKVEYVTYSNSTGLADESECVKNLTQDAVNVLLNDYVFLPAMKEGKSVDSYFEFSFKLGIPVQKEEINKTRRKLKN